MNHLQKNLLDFTIPVLIQTLGRTEKYLFSYFHHRSDGKYKYLLKNGVIRNLLNKILFSGSICKLLSYRFNDPKITRLSEVNWMPLIKANTTLSSAPGRHSTNCLELSEKYVLCIGGRGRLYPEYRYLVESLGGNLLIYRGNQKGDSDHLPDLLTYADMVVCPVDCVNHETYFAVKNFCNKSGKPCALLDRSDLPTFRKGIEILTGIST